MKKVLPFLLILALVLCCGCGKAEPRESKLILEEIITTYGEQPESSQRKLKRLFRELEAADSEKAALWQGIMDFWKSCDNSPVYENELPEGLPEDNSLCLVILGYQLNEDGTMQDELIGRLEVALRCAEQYPNAYVLCTGGATAKDNPDATEAGQMAAWLTEHGLAESRLLIESSATNTMENAFLSYQLLQRDQPQIHSLAIISSSYHVIRGSVLYESILLMTSGESEAEQIHVISNAAYPFFNENYPNDRAILQMQLMYLIN